MMQPACSSDYPDHADLERKPQHAPLDANVSAIRWEMLT
jgi:hypothetical protein